MQSYKNSKAKNKKPHRLPELVLGNILPDRTPSPQAQYRGRIASLIPYSTSSNCCTIKLVPAPVEKHPEAKEMDVELQGEWGSRVLEKMKGVQTVVFFVGNGKVVEGSSKKDDSYKWTRYKMVYERDIAGFYFDKDRDQVHFKIAAEERENNIGPSTSSAAPKVMRLDSSRSSQQGTKSVKTSSKSPEPVARSASASTSATPPIPRAPSLESRPTPRVVALTPAPSAPAPAPRVSRTVSPIVQQVVGAPRPVQQDVEMEQAEVPQQHKKRKVSDPGDGNRSAKKHKAVVRKWELKVSRKDFIFDKVGGSILYQPLKDLKLLGNSKGLNLIAVAIASSEPTKSTRGSKDWTTTLKLRDATLCDELVTCNWFSQTRELLPRPEPGDILVLQNLNWNKSNKQFVAYKDKARYLTLSSDALLSLADGSISGNSLLKTPLLVNRIASCGTQELDFAKDLAVFMAEREAPIVVGEDGDEKKLSAKERSDEFRKGVLGHRTRLTVSAMADQVFCDAFLEVIRVYTGGLRIDNLGQSDAVVVYFTDYTVNEELFDTATEAIVGQRVIPVSVFGSQAANLGHLKRGSLCWVRNLRCKYNPNDFLEGTIWPDEKYPNKRDVEHLTSKAMVMAHKEAYDEYSRHRKAYWDEFNSGVDPDAPAVDPAPAQAQPVASRIHSPRGSSDPIIKLSNVLDLSTPGIYYIRARVVDYYPQRLQDWVTAFCPLCGEPFAIHAIRCLDCAGEQPAPEILVKAQFVLRDASLPADREGLLVELIDGPGSTLLPDLKLDLNARSGSGSSFEALRRRFGPLLGELPDCKRRKVAPTSLEQCGEEAVMTVVASRENPEEPLRWQWAKGMQFRDG